MSDTKWLGLTEFSHALERLVETSAQGVVAVRAAGYRVVSGVCLGEGLIALPDHELKRKDKVPVVLPDGTEVSATILGRDQSVDVAVLNIEAGVLKPLATANPETIRAGMLAAVVGMTIDVGPSSSFGIIGAVGGPRRTWRAGRLSQFIRLDVNLYPSQSGAAVVNVSGELIGMANAALLRHAGLALPVATLRRVADELVKEGRIRRGYLGVGIEEVPIPEFLREKLRIAAQSGLMLLTVEPGASAANSGLQLGDILLSFDKQPTSTPEELQELLRGDAIGRSFDAVLIRAGNLLTVPITISEKVRSTRNSGEGE
jgi:serine protease Do